MNRASNWFVKEDESERYAKGKSEKQQIRIIHNEQGNNYKHKNILKVVMSKSILMNVTHKRNSRHYREHCRDEGYACDQEHGV